MQVITQLTSAGLMALVSPPEPTHVDEVVHEHAHGDERHSHGHGHTAAHENGHEHEHTDEEEIEHEYRVGAMVDIGYAMNSNLPANHVNRGHATAPRTGELALNYAAAYLLHAARPQSPFQLELALQAGSNVEATYAGEPTGAYVGADAFKHLGLANAGVLAPWGHDRGFDTSAGAGLFSSPVTLGSYWSKDSWNYSSAWANSATPYYLMGAHVTQGLGKRVNLSAWLLNGWQTIGEANHSPSGMGSLSIVPFEGFTIAEHFYFGPDRADISTDAWRIHSDTQVMYERERVGVGVFADYGQERRTDLVGEPVQRWAGGAVLGRWTVHQFEHARWDMGLRPEFWWESHGTFFGVPQTLVSASFTNGVDLYGHALLRVEYRYDHSISDDGFFYAGPSEGSAEGDALSSDQHTVFFSIVGYFERAFSGRRKSARSE